MGGKIYRRFLLKTPMRIFHNSGKVVYAEMTYAIWEGILNQV